MGKDALVILGAGASNDLMDEGQERLSANAAYKPPLTTDIFATQSSFQDILNRYPDASLLAETVRARPPDKQLESLLRELSESPHEHLRRQYKEVPLYLQELLGEISQHYMRGRQPPNYAYLVNQLFTSFERVTFVTLNYDLFLEQVLERPSLGGPINSLDWYINRHAGNTEWNLIKLHGSVNWGRAILNYAGPKRETRNLAQIGETDIDQGLDPEITILPGTGHQTRWIGDVPYYPAMMVPLENKQGFACPPSHVEKLEEFLTSCIEVLVIGVSGKDDDLLSLLRATLPQCIYFFLVDAKGKFLTDANSRLLRGVPQLQSPIFESFEGFSNFISSQGVEKFGSHR